MSLRSSIASHLKADTSLTALLDSSTDIHHGYIDGDSLNNDQVVWETRVATNEYALDTTRSFDVNLCTVKAISKNAVSMDTLGEAIKTSMLTLDSSLIGDVIFERDDYIYDDELNIHTLACDFTIWKCV